MNSKTICLRPHHLIDILKHSGNGRDLSKPHPYGHAQHEVTKKILSYPETEIEFVCKNDDICKSCSHLDRNNICSDIIRQCNPPVSKQLYNDELDRCLFTMLALKPGQKLTARKFLQLALLQKKEIILLATHPGQDEAYTANGLVNAGKQWGITNERKWGRKAKNEKSVMEETCVGK